jgi:hypothetical protein
MNSRGMDGTGPSACSAAVGASIANGMSPLAGLTVAEETFRPAHWWWMV